MTGDASSSPWSAAADELFRSRTGDLRASRKQLDDFLRQHVAPDDPTALQKAKNHVKHEAAIGVGDPEISNRYALLVDEAANRVRWAPTERGMPPSHTSEKAPDLSKGSAEQKPTSGQAHDEVSHRPEYGFLPKTALPSSLTEYEEAHGLRPGQGIVHGRGSGVYRPSPTAANADAARRALPQGLRDDISLAEQLVSSSSLTSGDFAGDMGDYIQSKTGAAAGSEDVRRAGEEYLTRRLGDHLRTRKGGFNANPDIVADAADLLREDMRTAYGRDQRFREPLRELYEDALGEIIRTGRLPESLEQPSLASADRRGTLPPADTPDLSGRSFEKSDTSLPSDRPPRDPETTRYDDLSSLLRQYQETERHLPTGLTLTIADFDQRLTSIKGEIAKSVSKGLSDSVAGIPDDAKGQKALDYFINAHRAISVDKDLSSSYIIEMVGSQLLDWARRMHVHLPL